MDPGRWQESERLYRSAIARPAAERAAFLADAGGGDAELKQEVVSLLDRAATSDG